MKEFYEKPEYELIDLLYEVFTNDSPESGTGGFDDEEEDGLLATFFSMVKGAFGFETNEDGSLVDADGNVYHYDENGNIVDVDGNIVFTADEVNASNQEDETTTENPEEDVTEGEENPDGEAVEEEVSEQNPPSETDLDQLGSLADQINDAVGDGSETDTAIPDDTSSGSDTTPSEEPIYEEPTSETPTSEPEGDYGFDGE